MIFGGVYFKNIILNLVHTHVSMHLQSTSAKLSFMSFCKAAATVTYAILSITSSQMADIQMGGILY